MVWTHEGWSSNSAQGPQGGADSLSLTCVIYKVIIYIHAVNNLVLIKNQNKHLSGTHQVEIICIVYQSYMFPLEYKQDNAMLCGLPC